MRMGGWKTRIPPSLATTCISSPTTKRAHNIPTPRPTWARNNIGRPDKNMRRRRARTMIQMVHKAVQRRRVEEEASTCGRTTYCAMLG